MSSGKVLLGVLAGVAAGALLGILFAPKEKFNEFPNDSTEKYEKVKEDVTDFAEHNKTKSDKEAKTATS
jgi:gas vesicle protein